MTQTSITIEEFVEFIRTVHLPKDEYDYNRETMAIRASKQFADVTPFFDRNAFVEACLRGHKEHILKRPVDRGVYRAEGASLG